MSLSAFSRLLSLHTWVQTILRPPPSGRCRQWKRAQSAFISVSTDSAGVAGIYGQLRSAVMETWLWGEGGSWTGLLLLLFQHRDVVCWSQGRWCCVIVCRMPLFKQFSQHRSTQLARVKLATTIPSPTSKAMKRRQLCILSGFPQACIFPLCFFVGGKIDFDKQNKISLFFAQPAQVPSCGEELLSVMSCRFWFL